MYAEKCKKVECTKYIAYICHTHPVILKPEPSDTLTITQITCMTFFMQRVCIVLLKTYTKSVRKVAIGTKRKIKTIKQPMKLMVVEKYTHEGGWCNHHLPPLSL